MRISDWSSDVCSSDLSKEQKEDLGRIFEGRVKGWKSLDYVAGWFMKAADFGMQTKCVSAFVSTNSICQGQQVPILWPPVFETGHSIVFAHTNRSEEHTSELQSLMRISYAVFCLTKKKKQK